MNVDIIYHIRASRERLSATEQKVADAVLADIDFAARANINELATRAGVSIATISRFARSVDCSDIRELKHKLARAGSVGERFLAPQLEESAFYSRIVGDIDAALRRHLLLFAEADFHAAAALIAKARMVYVIGMGGASTMLSDELQFRLARLGYAVASYHDAVLTRMLAATLTPEHTLVMLSTSGVTPELLATAEIAREYGAHIVALTVPGSPLASLASVVIPLSLEETDFIFKPSASRYAMLLAIDILATELALAHKSESQELLRRVKLALDDYRGGGGWLPLGD
ncbi:MurR/RpiR family transcriptional regulator [Chitinolyticbacter albus]|uniref:MurR/RpiR family transcriptional regulator n=1 Tax=Chitinolyticbacter albus TaxID=2961951 RepID=UPI00210E2AB5|nr:MurR/RpiR family transcriptional regulator [Chitinolyticbacter albus]